MSYVGEFSDRGEEISAFFLSQIIKDCFKTIAEFELVEEKIDKAIEKDFSSNYSALITIKGCKDIAFILSLPKQSCELLLLRMLKQECESFLQEDLLDGLMETANVIAGKIKVKLCNEGKKYSLSTPLAVVGQNHLWITKENVEGYTFKFKDKGFGVLVKVFFL